MVAGTVREMNFALLSKCHSPVLEFVCVTGCYCSSQKQIGISECEWLVVTNKRLGFGQEQQPLSLLKVV